MARHARSSPRSTPRASFLAGASAVLSSTLDYEAVLLRVAELAVPRIADWCAVFSRDDGDRIRCVTVLHRNAATTEKARQYITTQPIDIDAPHGVGKVIRTGVRELTNNVSEQMIRAVARDYDATLDALMRLAVPTLADWASALVLLRDGTVRRIGPAYADPALAPLAEELRRVMPSLHLVGSPSVTHDVVPSDTPILVSEIS